MQRKATFFYGWWVLIACAAVQFYFSGTVFSSFTALFNPIADEFRWSYALVSLAATFRGFEVGFMAPIVGFFVDKFRPRKVLFAGVILGAAGFFFFSRIQALWSFYAAYIILGMSLSMTSPVVVVTVIATWFKKRTSLAMGILTCGAGAAGLLMPGIVWLVDSFGWRRVLDIFAVGSLVICIPLCFLVRDPPGEDSTVKTGQSSPVPKPAAGGMGVREVLKKKNFWLLSLAVLFAGLTSTAVSAHQIPYLVSVGMTRETAGWMVVVFALSNVVGRLGFGWLGDIVDRRRCFMLSSVIQAVGLAAFAYSTSVAQVSGSLLILGIGLGGVVPLRSALQLEFFGLQAFATIQGLILISVTIGSMGSPPFAGWVYDSFKSYQLAWVALAVLTLIAVPIILSASKPGTTGNVTLSTAHAP